MQKTYLTNHNESVYAASRALQLPDESAYLADINISDHAAKDRRDER
jgi:hypothetical protein